MESNEPTAASKLLEHVINTGEQTEAPSAPVAGGIRHEILMQQIIEALSTVYDPEIPVNIYELGLIYDVIITPENAVTVKMTLTSPACPAAEQIPVEVENKIASIPAVSNVDVEIVWEPPYSMEMMSDAARLQLGLL